MAGNDTTITLHTTLDPSSLKAASALAQKHFKSNPVKLYLDSADIKKQLSAVSRDLQGLGTNTTFAPMTNEIDRLRESLKKLDAAMQQSGNAETTLENHLKGLFSVINAWSLGGSASFRKNFDWLGQSCLEIA